MILVIKAYFFGTNSYNFDKKVYIAYFFSFFYNEIVVAIYFTLVIIIKNLT